MARLGSRYGAMLFVCAVAAASSEAGPVYYSVGTSAADLKSGTPSVTLSAGTATFSSPQPANIGVGDEVTYNGGTVAFISGRTSSTVYTVTTKNGSVPVDTSGPVNSIRRAFNSLTAAQTGSSDFNHLNTTDLAGNNIQLNWACYDDAPMNDGQIRITGWTTGPTSYIRVFAPAAATEVGVSQRHTGVAGTGFRLVHVADLTGVLFYQYLRIEDDYVRLEGIEIDGSGLSNGKGITGLRVHDFVSPVSDIRFDKLIVHDLANTDLDNSSDSDVFGIILRQGAVKISNTLLYNLDNRNTHGASSPFALQTTSGNTATSHLHNNTIFNIVNSSANGNAPAGIVRSGGTVNVVNTAVLKMVPPGSCFAGTMTESNNVSSDGTAVGVTGQTSYATYFKSVTPGSEDLHLLGDSNSLWGSSGVDLSADPNLPIVDDVDGQPRGAGAPDIGADESVVVNFRSVGITSTNLNTTPRTVAISGSMATFSGAMPDNVGVGDVLTYNSGGNRLAFIVGRTSSTEFSVTDKDGALPTAAPALTAVGVYRAYTSLTNWESGTENPNITEPTENDVNPSTDLVAASTIMRVPAYADGPDVQLVNINGWNTGPVNYIEIYTPTNPSEVGATQRHNGTTGTGYSLNPPGASGIIVQDEFVRLRGLDISGQFNGVEVLTVGVSNEIRISDCLIHDLPDTWASGVYTFDPDAIVYVWNNIFYNIGTLGFTLDISNAAQIFAFNNTISDAGGDGINVQAGVCLAKNNLIANSGGNNYAASGGGSFHPSSDYNWSDDGTDTSGANDINSGDGGWIDVTFLDEAGDDFHISASDAGARDRGDDLSADPTLAFGTDIDLQTRPLGSAWDIGADETSAQANYHSIGTDTSNLHAGGTVSVSVGSDTVSFSNPLPAATAVGAVGRGDELDINGEIFYIVNVNSPTEVLVDHPAQFAHIAEPTFMVHRAFNSIAAWEAARQGDLVGENRLEVGVAYKDGLLSVAAEIQIDGSTTDATHFMWLTVDAGQRHQGVAATVPTDNVVVGRSASGHVFLVNDDYFHVSWLEITGWTGNSSEAFRVNTTGFRLDNSILHGATGASADGIHIKTSGITLEVNNTFMYDIARMGVHIQDCSAGGTDGDNITVHVRNSTFFNMSTQADASGNDGGIGFSLCVGPTDIIGSVIVATNTYVHSVINTAYRLNGGSFAGGDFNASHDTSAPGTTFLHNEAPASHLVSTTGGSEDLHLLGASTLIDQGTDLSSVFFNDIDNQSRLGLTWDIGADEVGAPTAVELISFVATGLEGAVELTWETATELDNVGFHLYRAPSTEGPYERVTAQVIPGLGSSPAGARYRYVDSGLTNAVTYHYELEDIETTGKTERHGPVSGTPVEGAVSSQPSPSTSITYGEPEENELRIIRTTNRFVEYELVTRGFYAEPNEDGTVDVSIPDFVESEEASVPVRRFWLELPTDRAVKRLRVVEREVERFSGLTPAGLSAALVAERDGTVRAARRRRRRANKNMLPEQAARVVSQGFQGQEHKALLELAPVRFGGELTLTKRLVVRVVLGKARATERRVRARSGTWRLITQERGLYAVRYRAHQVRLSRQGETVPYHREGRTLYFLGEKDAVYELSREQGTAMNVVDGTPSGPVLPYYWHTESREENRFYQAALVNAPDVWLWDYLIAPMEKDFDFEVSGLASSEHAKLRVWLQGTSELSHHVRVLVNGNFVGETRWGGQNDHVFEAETPVLEGTNTLTLASVGTTNSMMMLDRFEVAYPRQSTGELEGVWDAGTADVSGLDEAYVLDVSEDSPRWVEADGASFRTEAGRRYLVAAQPKTPEIVRVRRSNLLKKTRRAQWILIGPEAFLADAKPLQQHRQAQGLRAKAVSMEAIYDEFGYGEQRPEAIRDFLTAVYQETASLRYVVLLGDGTFDFEDYLGTGVQNQVPPMMVKTSYLWTASDPAYAAVNGDDLLPDIAIGRLPAATVLEARTMVRKILAFERGETSLLDGPVVLVADNPDRAGDFVADAEALASKFLSGKSTTKLYLPNATRNEVVQAFDDGASLVSYLGHGAIHLWADENVFNANDVASLSSQSQQPLLLTMNCLNGYFHFPYFDSLAEALLKAEDKGVIAAFSPSGLSLNEPAKRYQEALVDELFHGGHTRLGDAVLEAQRRYAETGAFPELLTIYHLFGDPALTLR